MRRRITALMHTAARGLAPRRRTGACFPGCVVALAITWQPAAAQLPADASWRTFESAHYRVTFVHDLEPVARQAVAAAERAHAALSQLTARPPRGRIDIVIADNVDFSNGYATPFPSNRVVIYVRPPTDILELQYTRDWVELVVTHELAHIFHLDATGSVGRFVRAIFGRVPLPWPAFPALGTPQWSIEGLAVGAESAITGYGRIHGSYNEMIVRTAALADGLDEYDRLGTSSARWPGAARAYVYGSLFMNFLERRHGADAAARIVRATTGAIIPPPLWFGAVGRDALGTTFRDAYAEWLREVTTRADSVAAVLGAEGLTESRALTRHRAIAMYPRYSPDGSRIVYAAHDWREPPQLRIVDAATGRIDRSIRINQPASASWLSSDTLITSEPDFIDQFRVFSDLSVVTDDTRRITRGVRLQEPHAHRSGRVVAIQTEGGTNRIVLVDRRSGEIRPITPYTAGTFYSLPRLSPAGDRIAVSRWEGAAHDIVVMDTTGTRVVLTDGFGVNTAPAWSPDGRWILFGSDRTGIPNLYAVDVASSLRAHAAGTSAPPALRQVTNILTGAFQPDVSPDGRTIAFAVYHHDGFRIEVMPFDTSLWRTPAAPGAAARVAARPVDDSTQATARPRSSIAELVADADTTSGASRDYRALRSMRPHFWAPTLEAGSDDATWLGAWTYGQDLVERHIWQASLAFETGSGRSEGLFSYTFAGLPTIRSIGMHPSITAHLARDWDVVFRAAEPDGLRIDEREDVARAGVALSRRRWRTSAVLTLAGERVLRSRELFNAPDNTQLVDPDDDLWGIRASAAAARYVTPPLSISRQSGWAVQVAALRRSDADVRTFVGGADSTRLDASYSEITTANAAYLTLPFAGFARHVLALRFSALLRDGPGSGLSSIGGVSGAAVPLSLGGVSLGQPSLLLPVRGFPRGVRAGSRAWTASVEYRAPLALIDRPLRPFFFDRLSGALFADAGHAWCQDDLAALRAACTSTSPTGAPLLSAGVEVTLLFSVLGFSAPLRAGAAWPIRGGDEPRLYILTGPSF